MRSAPAGVVCGICAGMWSACYGTLPATGVVYPNDASVIVRHVRIFAVFPRVSGDHHAGDPLSALHGWFSADSDLAGVQKFHDLPVPRIGGLGIFVAVLLAMFWRYSKTLSVAGFGLVLLVAALPAFGFGFVEDVTKRVGVSVRLLATAVSAALAGWLLGAWLPSLQIFGVDTLMAAYPWLAIVITCFCCGGCGQCFQYY